MGLLNRKREDPNGILNRIENPSDEPEVVAAAEARGRAEAKAEALARELAALTDRVDAAEREMASAILDGKSTDTGEDLPSLRLARGQKREEYSLTEKVAELARERLQGARAAAKARLKTEFEEAHRKLVATLAKEVDEAMRANTVLRDLEDRARSVIGQGQPSLFYHGLVPATPTYFSRFADWSAEIERFLKRN